MDKPTESCNEQNGICLTHRQSIATCWQMAKGNFCSGCRDWHTKDYNCKKVN